MTRPKQPARPYAVPDDATEAVHLDQAICRGPVHLHVHPVFELTVFEGDGQRQIGDRQDSYQDGDLVLIGPDLPHAWNPAPGQQPWAQAALFGHRAVAPLLAPGESEHIADLLDLARRGIVFSRAAAREAATRLQAMHGMSRYRRRLSLLLLLDELSQDGERRLCLDRDYTSAGSHEDYRLLAKLLHHADQHGYSQLTLAAMAELAGMSQPSFTRFFRRMTGSSFIDYCNDRRIAQACALLRETDWPVLRISQEVGFDNLSHFNRQFKRRRQATPTRYRRQAPQGEPATR